MPASSNALRRDFTAHGLDLILIYFREGKIVGDAQMPLGHAVKASGPVITQNAGLDIVGIGRHQAEFFHAMAAKQIIVGQNGSGGRRAGAFGNAGAQSLVIVET